MTSLSKIGIPLILSTGLLTLGGSLLKATALSITYI